MIKNQTKPQFTIRMKAYSLIILLLASVLWFFILSRKDVDVTILRAAGMLYQEQPGGYVSNLYNAEFINKSTNAIDIDLKPSNDQIKIKWIQAVNKLAKENTAKATFFLMIPEKMIKESKTKVELLIFKDGKVLYTVKTNFLGPVN